MQKTQFTENDILKITYKNLKDPLVYYAIVFDGDINSIHAAYGSTLEEVKYNKSKYENRLDELDNCDSNLWYNFVETEATNYARVFDLTEWSVEIIKEGRPDPWFQMLIKSMSEERKDQELFRLTSDVENEPHLDESIIESIGLDYRFRVLFMSDITKDNTGFIRHILGCKKCSDKYREISDNRFKQTIRKEEEEYHTWLKDKNPNFNLEDNYGIGKLFD